MNKRLFRTQFNQMENIEKQVLMESLAARYDMTFLGLHTFDRWGQNCTTGIFEKDGREVCLCPRRYRHPGLGAVCRGTESGEPGGIGVSVPGMGNGTAEPGGDDPGKHGSRPASGHWPHAGGPGVGGN